MHGYRRPGPEFTWYDWWGRIVLIDDSDEEREEERRILAAEDEALAAAEQPPEQDASLAALTEILSDGRESQDMDEAASR